MYLITRIARAISHHLSKSPTVVLEENKLLFGEEFYSEERNELLADLLYEDTKDIIVLTTSTLIEQLTKSSRALIDCTFKLIDGNKYQNTHFRQLMTIVVTFSDENMTRGEKFNQLVMALYLPSKELDVYRHRLNLFY